MRLSFGLEQKLVQKQVLAPRMIQSMEILQLPLMALQERIEQELVENPMLEESPEAPEDGEPGEEDGPEESSRDADTAQIDIDRMLDYLRGRSGIAHWVGCVGMGLCSSGRETYAEPGLSKRLGHRFSVICSAHVFSVRKLFSV